MIMTGRRETIIVRGDSVSCYITDELGECGWNENGVSSAGVFMNEQSKRDFLAQVREILKGIDRQEGHHEDGWWETSIGAEFGQSKLREIENLIEGLKCS